MCLERAKEPVGKHEDALANGNARLTGEAPIHLGHDTGKLLVAHEHRADGVLMVVERVVEARRRAAVDAEHHVGAGFLQRADNALRRPRLRMQPLACHGSSAPDMWLRRSARIEPFTCSLGRMTMHHKPRYPSLGRPPA